MLKSADAPQRNRWLDIWIFVDSESCDITSGWNRSDMFHFSFSISRVVFRTTAPAHLLCPYFMSHQCQCQFISYTCVWPSTPMYMNKSFSFDEALELSKACCVLIYSKCWVCLKCWFLPHLLKHLRAFSPPFLAHWGVVSHYFFFLLSILFLYFL